MLTHVHTNLVIYVTEYSWKRLKNFNIGITNMSVIDLKPAPHNYQLFAHHEQPFRDYLLITCEGGPVTGRYVVLQLLGTDHLHMCPFQVFTQVPREFL
jgi:hypothetical protein